MFISQAYLFLNLSLSGSVENPVVSVNGIQRKCQCPYVFSSLLVNFTHKEHSVFWKEVNNMDYNII